MKRKIDWVLVMCLFVGLYLIGWTINYIFTKSQQNWTVLKEWDENIISYVDYDCVRYRVESGEPIFDCFIEETKHFLLSGLNCEEEIYFPHFCCGKYDGCIQMDWKLERMCDQHYSEWLEECSSVEIGDSYKETSCQKCRLNGEEVDCEVYGYG